MTTNHLFVGKKLITAVFVFLFTVFGIQSSYADYYPSGIQQDVPEQTLIDNGWTLFYEATYSTANSSTGSEFRPSGSFVIVTGKSVGSNILNTVAAAPTAQVFTETELDTPQLLNGTYWYYTPGESFGYSPTNVVFQVSADTTGCDSELGNANACASDPSRLSWHLTEEDGGFRLGNAGWINSDVAGGNLYLKFRNFRKVISNPKIGGGSVDYVLTKIKLFTSFYREYQGGLFLEDTLDLDQIILDEINDIFENHLI